MWQRSFSVALVLAALVPCAACAEVRVYFSGGAGSQPFGLEPFRAKPASTGGCDRALVQLIRGAQSDLDAACYTFTLDSVADELIGAQARGIRVRVLLDRSHSGQPWSQAGHLVAAGIPVKVNSHSGLMHHKFLVADGKSVATGSFNWTKSAIEKNDENLVVFLDEPKVARAFAAEFDRM